MKKTSIFWFRRDLRLNDNTGLIAALKHGNPVQCIFIFDTCILDKLIDKHDARVNFIHQQLNSLNNQLQQYGSSLFVYHGDPVTIWKSIAKRGETGSVFCNHDYEPYARLRDQKVGELLSASGIPFRTFKDQVIFEKDEVIKDDGKPYTVYTPYKNKWLKTVNRNSYATADLHDLTKGFFKCTPQKIVSLKEIGFSESVIRFPSQSIPDSILLHYASDRDFPGKDATSRISVHLRFGTVSIRSLAKRAAALKSDVWLNELIWRDFYHMILWHFPHVAKSAFKPAYDKIVWRNNEKEFQAWCEGKTGYPIVDAGMRELNATGFMHNRVRMIVASFLVKHLLIDWRWGEAYFAQKLLDFDLAANNGGWQWAAGCGCDAAPYFRIFNPYEQTKKFDPKFGYIRKWVPEFEDFNYPAPIVEHTFARKRCLETFKSALAEM